MSNRLPSPWREFLVAIDAELTDKVELHCIGGFVLTAVYGIARSTADLDYLAAKPADRIDELETIAGRASPLAKKHHVHLQHVGAVPDVPENYDERLTKLDLGLKKLRLMALDPYDLCLSKLTRNSPKDREDVKALASHRKLHFQILVDRYTAEMKPWLANRARHELPLGLWREYFPQ